MTGTVHTGDGWTLVNGDCVEAIPAHLAADSVDLSVYSPPFISLFTYTASERDMGNCANTPEFFEHFGFIIRELLRVTRPGRLTCVHVAQVPAMLERRIHRHEGFPRRHNPRLHRRWVGVPRRSLHRQGSAGAGDPDEVEGAALCADAKGFVMVTAGARGLHPHLQEAG
jgi:hypothetical protein